MRAIGLPATLRARAAWLLLIAVVVFMTVRSIRKAYHGNDFGVYHAAARAVLSGDDLFGTRDSIDQRPYLYPPTLAVLLVPWTTLPEPTAGVIWAFLNVLLLCFVFEMYRHHGRGPPGAGIWTLLALLATFAHVDSNFVNGQVNLLVLAAILDSWLSARRGRWFVSGAAIGFAACVKATPLIFVAYFVWRRSGRALAGVVAGIVVFAIVIPGLLMGFDRALESNRQWVEHMAIGGGTGAFEHGTYGDRPEGRSEPNPAGYSVRSFLHVWLTDTPVSIKPDAPSLNVLSLDPSLVEWLYRLVALGMLAAAFLVGLRRPRSASDLFREFALIAATMVLISPLSRKAHFVAMLPAALWIARTWWQTRDRRLLVWLAVSTVLLDVAMYTGVETIKQHLVGGGLYFVSALLLWVVILRTPPPEPEESLRG